MATSPDTQTNSVTQWATAVIRRLTELGIPKEEIKNFFMSEELAKAAIAFRAKLGSIQSLNEKYPTRAENEEMTQIIIQVSTDITRSGYIINARCITKDCIWKFNGRKIISCQVYVYNSGEKNPVPLNRKPYEGVIKLASGGTAIVRFDNDHITIEVSQK